MADKTIGILAHVDAGKTTLIEALLYKAGAIRKAGRVDHQDTLLDYVEQERARGITIYSKQAVLDWKGERITCIDTPGHADFSAEMERSLQALDTAVVLISALDGVQSHTRTIWDLLDHYQIPALLFINKLDIARYTPEELLESVRSLHPSVIDLSAPDALEQLAMVNDDLLDEYMETGTIRQERIIESFLKREFFPVFFGSALKIEGMEGPLDFIAMLPARTWPDEFGARVIKTTEDGNTRLTYLKITGGTLSARQVIGEEKADQIRLYSGTSYTLLPEATAGMVVAVKGLDSLRAGQGLGFEKDSEPPRLSPCLTYRLLVPHDADPNRMEETLRRLSAEDPSLQVTFGKNQEAELSFMGAVQQEILQKEIFERTGVQVGFGPGRIVYKETIAAPVYGFGHFEPLRHYAEVHVRLTPLPAGSGIQTESRLSIDELGLNWQSQAISALQNSRHRGVLTGSELTDVKISLINGAASRKHTEGGDFRQASQRAVRQGLTKAENVLLEPFYDFTLSVDPAVLSRALYDLDTRKAEVKVEEEGDRMKISGRGPVRTLMNYQSEVAAFTRGSGRFVCSFAGYYPSPEPGPIIESLAYEPELDRFHPCGSVFCAGGAGYYVPPEEAEEKMHLPLPGTRESSSIGSSGPRTYTDEQARAAFERAGGRNASEKKKAAPAKRRSLPMEPASVTLQEKKGTTLIVDGYNMIYSWPELKDISRTDLAGAREALISELSNYAGYKGWSLVVVFDGYRRANNPGSASSRGAVRIVYTHSGLTADGYIEKAVREMKGSGRILVATSDGLIQNSVLSHGAERLSARELESRVKNVSWQALSHLK